MARIRNIQNSKLKLVDLLRGCKQKDQYFQKLLFERYASRVFTTCRRYSTVSYPAKDILQDTFLKAFEKIHQFDESKGKFESWLSRIAINLALNAIRDKKMTFVELDFEISQSAEKSDFMPDLSEEKILALINKLPLGYKTVFNLFVIDGFSHQKIAQELNISISTSKSQLFKAKRILRQQILSIKKSKYGGF